MAISNISQALDEWKKKLQKGLDSYEQEYKQSYSINNNHVGWKLKFAGYIVQQYTAKTKKGNREPVRAYEKILNQVPKKIGKYFDEYFTTSRYSNIIEHYNLGEIPNLHSLIPMSQSAHSPIFKLKAKDGVVGAHFVKVNDAESIYRKITKNFLDAINYD